MADCRYILPLLWAGMVGVEIGVRDGHSSVAFLERGCFLYMVDPWEDYPEYPEKTGHDAQYENVLTRVAPFKAQCRVLRMSADRAAEKIPNDLDFVFIDGNHTAKYVRLDIEAYWPKLKSGGWLTGHDYTYVEGNCDVKPVVDQFILDHPALRLEIYGDSWAIRKP